MATLEPCFPYSGGICTSHAWCNLQYNPKCELLEPTYKLFQGMRVNSFLPTRLGWSSSGAPGLATGNTAAKYVEFMCSVVTKCCVAALFTRDFFAHFHSVCSQTSPCHVLRFNPQVIPTCTWLLVLPYCKGLQQTGGMGKRSILRITCLHHMGIFCFCVLNGRALTLWHELFISMREATLSQSMT